MKLLTTVLIAADGIGFALSTATSANFPAAMLPPCLQHPAYKLHRSSPYGRPDPR